jgi:hypothetical protein
MINNPPGFVEFRIDRHESRVEQTELGTLIATSRVEDGQWTLTIRALDPMGRRFLGGGHRILMEPLSYDDESTVVAAFDRGMVVIRDLSSASYRVRFTPNSTRHSFTATSRAAFASRPSTERQGTTRRRYRTADPSVRLEVEEDAIGAAIDVYAEKSSDSNVVVVLRGQKYGVALQPDKGVWRGRLDVGTQFGDDLYVE